MKISFDNLRKHIGYDFNAVVETIESSRKFLPPPQLKELTENMNTLRGSIGGLLAYYVSKEMPDDFNDLSGEIKLLEL